MTEVTLSGAWMALTDPNGFTPRHGEGADARPLPGDEAEPDSGTSRPLHLPRGLKAEASQPASQTVHRNDPAASKGGAVRIASALSAGSAPPRQSDRRVEWVRSAVAQFERPLTQYCLHLLGGDLERARDLVQEAFLRLCDQEQDAIEGHLVEWLYTVCRNLAIDLKRKERRMRLITDEQQDSFAATYESPTDAAERVDASSRVNEMIQSLSSRQQEILRLKFQHGMSYKEIGEVLNLTATNVGFILHTAIKSLREGMGSDSQRAATDT